MAEVKWNVYWNEYSSDTYLYGSSIKYHAMDDVEFYNDRMPPGTVIKEWYSKVNYQEKKIEPTLPIIDGEGAYHITLHLDSDYEEGCMVRLVFYDRYDMEAGSVMIRGNEGEFRCPLKTFSYRVQLISSGATGFRFHSIVIREVEDEEN